jgi:hypothetical protein
MGLGFLCVSVRLSVRSSDILLARFVRRLIGRKGGREVSSLSLTHTHTQIRRWVLTHSHTQLGLVTLRFLCVSVRLFVCSSDILLARFVRRLIGRKGGREVSSLSLTHTHTHTQIRRWVLTHSHIQLGLVLEIFKECSQYHTQNVLNREDCLNLCKLLTWRVTLLFYWQTRAD